MEVVYWFLLMVGIYVTAGFVIRTLQAFSLRYLGR